MLVEVVCLCVVTLVVIQLVRLIFADCDLSLQWAELFGRSSDTLRGQVVWVTGASSGIGEFLAYELASVGCRLVLSARREGELNRVKNRCLGQGLKNEDVLVLPLDLLDMNSHQTAVDKVITHFKHIDVLVNNAGRSQRGLLSNISVEVDRECLELNTLGPISLTKRVLPHMAERKQGQVVVVSSLAGKFGAPGISSYCASKHALHGWFESLRIEGHDNNIKVTMVCPGPVFSNALKAAFTENSGESLDVAMKTSEKRLSTSRCARQIAVAMANQLDEVWLSLHPELFFLYIFQYMPSIARRLSPVLAGPRYRKLKEGKVSLH